jgi:hypothetical protein
MSQDLAKFTLSPVNTRNATCHGCVVIKLMFIAIPRRNFYVMTSNFEISIALWREHGVTSRVSLHTLNEMPDDRVQLHVIFWLKGLILWKRG